MANHVPSSNSAATHEDPLSIQSSDHLGMKLVSHAFEGNGFGNWKRSLLIALSAKNKLGFIDGTQKKPSSTDPTAKAWQRCNNMYFLGFSMFCLLKLLILCFIAILLMMFVWDEIEAMGMNPTCSCTCIYGSKTKQLKIVEDQKIVQFLLGLNDSYTVIRGTILMQSPLPKISTIYNNLLQEERQRIIHHSAQFQADSASFYAKTNKNGFGYVDISSNHSQRAAAVPECRKPFSNVSNVLECRYYAQDVSVQNDSSVLGRGPMSVDFASNSFSFVTFDSLHHSWIIDSGATDHMCSNKSMFFVLTPIPKPYTISLPTDQVVTIDSIRSVHVSSEIILHGVLFVLCFRFNLLFVAKLVKQLYLHVCFTSDLCFLQGSSLKKPLILGRNHKDLFLLHTDTSLSRPSHEHKEPASSFVSDSVAIFSNSVVTSNNSVVWYNRLGHLPLYKLKFLNLCNFTDANNNDIASCSICVKFRQHRLSFPNSTTSSPSAFELIHIDVWGPYPIKTYNGYIVTPPFK
ncbi:hypothetical protein RND81_06G055800 [Saponaria officinalis]|uniref:Retrotransposon Copia-like N-terminal domain-containing protein n=1 Tax=Saponaria officinalis TaxID=3572 RepID=A0AAW1K8A8_SAPOF